MHTHPDLSFPTVEALPPPPAGKTGWPWTVVAPMVPALTSNGGPWPKVTIVTPSYNQGSFLEETIRSVLLQGYPNLEYIVMDGGSQDGSVDVIQKYAPWIAHWESHADRGQSDAINRGFRLASGQVIGWLNSDDSLLPDTLFRIIDVLQGFPTVGVVHGSVNYVDAQGALMFVPLRREDEFRLDNALVGGIYQPGAFWRKSVTDEIGLLNEDLHYVMDYEYWMRMALADVLFRGLDGAPLANFRITEHSKTGKEQHMFGLEMQALVRWFLAQPELKNGGKCIPFVVRRRAMKAQSVANLRIAQSYAHLADRRVSAFAWLLRSMVHYPPNAWLRRREIFNTMVRICSSPWRAS